jgi:hypothetical protein
VQFRLAFDWAARRRGTHERGSPGHCLGLPVANAMMHDPRSSVADLEAGVGAQIKERSGPAR